MIGPTFAAELAAAGLAGLPITWTAAGTIIGRDALTGPQNAALDAVIAAHDPEAAPVEEPAALPPRVVAAAFGVQVADGDVAAIAGPFNVVGAFYEGVGVYTFVYNAEVSADCFVTFSDPRLSAVVQETGFCTAEARDSGGTLIDIARFDAVVSSIAI